MTARLSPAAILLAALVALFAYKIAREDARLRGMLARRQPRRRRAEPLYREEDEHFQLKNACRPCRPGNTSRDAAAAPPRR